MEILDSWLGVGYMGVKLVKLIELYILNGCLILSKLYLNEIEFKKFSQ